jgi:hypothetical protein
MWLLLCTGFCVLNSVNLVLTVLSCWLGPWSGRRLLSSQSPAESACRLANVISRLVIDDAAPIMSLSVPENFAMLVHLIVFDDLA